MGVQWGGLQVGVFNLTSGGPFFLPSVLPSDSAGTRRRGFGQRRTSGNRAERHSAQPRGLSWPQSELRVSFFGDPAVRDLEGGLSLPAAVAALGRCGKVLVP